MHIELKSCNREYFTNPGLKPGVIECNPLMDLSPNGLISLKCQNI